MKSFYKTVLGFDIEEDLGDYIEFKSPGVRFAICKRSVMKDITGNTAYDLEPQGQSFELAFSLDSKKGGRLIL